MRWLRKWLRNWLIEDTCVGGPVNASSFHRRQGFHFMEAENGYIIEYYDHRADVTRLFVCSHNEDISAFILSTLTTVKLTR
jgi:hypothetical protein